MSNWLCRWFGIGCPSPTPVPPTPVPPAAKAVAVVVTSDGRPVVGAKVQLDGDPNTFPPTNGDGYTLDPMCPASLTASQLTVTADGFDPYSEHVDLIAGEQTLRPVLKSKHVDPSTFTLRDLAKVRGAMWTVRGPWAFGPRPGDPSNITALEYIYCYGSDPNNLTQVQKDMLAKYKSYGYTHLAFGPINAESYHGQYPDVAFTDPASFEVWLDWLQMFWDNGLAPICFLHGDGDTFDQTVAMYDHLIRGNARAQRLMRIVVPTGWEPTKYDWSSVTWAKFCQWAGDLLPNALVLIHTVADVDAPVGTDALYDDNGKPNGEGWSRVAAVIHGWLIQNGAYTVAPSADPTLSKNFAGQFDPGALGAEVHGAAWHFANGIAGWPTFSKWGNERIYLYNAECTSYEAYWHNLPYEVSTQWGDLAIQSGADGYLDSGTVAVKGR